MSYAEMSGLKMDNMDLVSQVRNSDFENGETAGENIISEDTDDDNYSFDEFQSDRMIIQSQNDISDGEDYSHFDDNDFPCSASDDEGNLDDSFSSGDRGKPNDLLSSAVTKGKPSTNRLSVDKNDNTIILTEEADFPKANHHNSGQLTNGEGPETADEDESPRKRKRVLRFLKLDNGRKRKGRWNFSSTIEYQNFWKFFEFPEFDSKPEENGLDTQEMEGMKEWLQSNMVPVSQVKSSMENTFRLRRRELESPNCLLVNFIQQWPRLFDYPGMIDAEFLRMHKSAGTLQVVWPTLAENLLSHMTSRNVLRQQFGVDKHTLTTEEATYAAVLLLPYLIDSRPPKPKKPTKKMRKPAKAPKGNLSDSEFIRILPPETHLYHFSQQPDLPTQPFIVISGNASTLTFDNYAFMIERQIVACTSFLEAVDFCFKSFWIFNLQLPQGAEQIWSFLGNVVYNVVGDEVLFPGTKRLKNKFTTAANSPSLQ